MTAGSAFGLIPGTRPFFDKVGEFTSTNFGGMGGPHRQEFSWNEKVSW